MKCVYFDNQRPDSFEEQFAFSKEIPYTVQIKNFLTDDIVPLHYAPTLEVLLCDGLEGHITIDSRQYTFSGRQFFVIPPRIVHSTCIPACSGTQYVLKISFEDIAHYFDLQHYLDACGCQPDSLAYFCPNYDSGLEIISQLIEHDGDLPQCLIQILTLLHLLSKHTENNREPSEINTRFKSSSLQELVNWTQQNYMRKIPLSEVASLTGYSKYHFCSRFKAMTGMTYLNYLNSVRISRACTLLQKGEAVQKVCHDVGFDNLSYFIQLFKKLRYVTPYQYILNHKADL